jgi:hypothetical protein
MLRHACHTKFVIRTSLIEIQSNTALTVALESAQFKHHDFQLYPVLSTVISNFYLRLLTVYCSHFYRSTSTFDVGNVGLTVSETIFPPSRLLLWWNFLWHSFCLTPNVPSFLFLCSVNHRPSSAEVTQRVQPYLYLPLWQCTGTPLPWPLPLQTTSLAWWLAVRAS